MPVLQINTFNETIRFNYYLEDAPHSVAAFLKALPFTCNFFHARFSGLEIWTDHAPDFDVIQENASIFTSPGEIVLGPVKPVRTKTAKCIGIYYGEGKGLDCGNIFGKVFDEDFLLLKNLGEQVWKKGAVDLSFSNLK